ncbi:hypothetical protein BT69DRAFT_1212995 [Atractiella rhizophila]|nr:hypothetical protein BT69DRAFT_1212995 [Atractiella rhizophila]
MNSVHSIVYTPPSPSVLSRRERPLSQPINSPSPTPVSVRAGQRFIYPEVQEAPPPQQQQPPPPQVQPPPRPRKEPLSVVHAEEEYEDPSRLKAMRFPSQIVDTFLSLSDRNTRMGIETLGLLLGKQVGKEYLISHLLVPKQSGTPDTCAMDEDMSAFEYGWEKELNQLGWIHTHPTQATFMSSVDLHTHMNYQSTLREAIAIVCAPTSSPSYGIFRLTDPPGLKIIQDCREGPQFHPHAELPIYTDADGYNGHAIPSIMELQVCDLRSGQEFCVPPAPH